MNSGQSVLFGPRYLYWCGCASIIEVQRLRQARRIAVAAEDYDETSNDESTTIKPIPHGGWQGWVQVFLSHLINFNSFGFMLSFGIFQKYYTDTLNITPSNVSWIGTTSLFLVYFVGVFSGRAMDAGYYRYTLATGIAFQLIGVFATSFSTTYYQLFLAQGLCQGVGNGLVFTPCVALVSTYFEPRRRSVAVSLVACGGATGGMVFPALAQSLLDKIGFAWTVRIMGFVMLTTSAIVLPFSKPRLQSHRKAALIDKSALKEVPYLLFCGGIFLGFWGLYFAYYYVRPFGREILNCSSDTSFNLILVINSFGIPGRILPAVLADRFFTPLDVLVPFICINGILLYCWIAITSIPSFYVWVAVYGFFAGGSQSLFQASASGFTKDPSKAGIRIGMVCTFVSFACLSGPPISGKLVEYLNGRYLAAQLFGGSVMLAGGIALFGSRVARNRAQPSASQRSE
ncbi:putative monocarboxylate permease [Tothia fuscella]|uniref:Monocarboxylate permease n=1 Tax=Tothia fuscella TaxID=1048955 RepID=A0A9P4U0R5_9PEZI|nr:putative monocarboxylate permease [Tothia fuscella]